MSTHVRLVFRGELVPGVDPAVARGNLARLLKLDPAQVEAVFSGHSVVLKNALPAADAPRYADHLAGLGVRVHVEAIAPPPAGPALAPAPVPGAAPVPFSRPAATPFPAAVPAPPVPPASALPEVPQARKQREVICPSCGTVQPQRVLCRQCGADMVALANARAEEKAEAAALLAAEAEIRARGGNPNAGPGDDAGPEVPKILSFDFSGRMGRLTYLLANLLISPLTMVLALIALRDRNMVLLLGAFIIPAIINLRASVLRCHDLGWSGWLVLLSMLPYIGWIFWLVLLLMPGNAAMNGYGDPPGASPGRKVALAGLLCVVVAAATFGPILAETRKIATEQAEAASRKDPRKAPPQKAPAAEPPRAVAEAPAPAPASEPAAGKTYDGSINTVIVYTVGDCVPCSERRQELARIGLYPREIRVDLNENASDDMIAKLVRAGHPVSSLQMPVVDVNGTLLNNPSVAQVERHLR